MNSNQIRLIRRKLGLTQQAFAEALGVAKSTVGRWEIDKAKPSPLAETKLRQLSQNHKFKKES
jgi:putative transcriptional regulator